MKSHPRRLGVERSRPDRDTLINGLAFTAAAVVAIPVAIQGNLEGIVRIAATLAALWLGRHAARESAQAWASDGAYVTSLALTVLAVVFVLGGIWL